MTENLDSHPQVVPANEATVEVGGGRVHIRVKAPQQTQLRIDLEAASSTRTPVIQRSLGYGVPLAAGASFSRWFAVWRERVRTHWDTAAVLSGCALIVYLITRWIALPEYPIYFFSDEAVQTTLAADLIRDHLRAGGELLPALFKNAYQYNLGTSVYLQVVPYLMFGTSIWVTRGVSALVTLIAAFSLWLAMKKVFHSAYPWSAVLLLSITPAWFLHSRTAFETGVATAFYAGFFYTYLIYRTQKPQMLYGSVVFAALSFYSYSPARLVVLITSVLFFFSDLKYHWQQRKIVLGALGLVLLAALPFLRFEMNHPQENVRHLEVLNSYWIRDISLQEKLGIYFREYLHGLDPAYWYSALSGDMPRHVMKGYGHLLRATLPLGLIGLILVLSRIRQAPYRAVLLALLAAPSGGALVKIGITRVLILVIPAALISALGLAAVMGWVQKRWQLSRWKVGLPVFVLLAGFNFWMLRDALVNGPFWHTDYGLGGMQWGARQIFGEIREMTSKNPRIKISLSPSWANGTDAIAQFFFEAPMPFQMESIVGYFDQRRTLDGSRVFIMIPEEYEKVIHSLKFTNVQVDQIINYPNGQPGFYFVRLEYSEAFDAILAQESAQRRILQEAEVKIDGQPAMVKYSFLDMGTAGNLFDRNPLTLVRTFEANPLRLEITFDQPRTLSGIKARIGGTATIFSFRLVDSDGKVMYSDQQDVKETPDPRWLEFTFTPHQDCRQVFIEVKSTRDKEPAHVHLWEITFN